MASQSESSGITILVTDDSPVYVRFAEKILEKNGYSTLTAMDGMSCIKAAKSLNPDLILLDVIMPGINGFEVCRVLKQDVETKDIPIIFVTANTDDETLKKAFMSGGTDYVRKPPNRIELLARIKSALAQKELVAWLFVTLCTEVAIGTGAAQADVAHEGPRAPYRRTARIVFPGGVSMGLHR